MILSQFRNYVALKTDLIPGLNVFTGPNGSGKTSVLEGIHYLCMTRGFSPNSDRNVLRKGEQFFIVEGQSSDQEWIKCTYLEGRGKKIFHDQVPLERMSSHIGRIPVISVLPSDTDLIRESGTTRRKYLDALISQYDVAYLQALVRYEQALSQRNAALQSFLKSGRWDAEQLMIWDVVLIREGMIIHAGRENFLRDFIPVFRKYYQLISGEQEVPDIEYETVFTDNSREYWVSVFEMNRDKDRFSSRTQQGTHREDLKFLLNGELVRDRGSQGQQKSFVMALKLANFVFLKEQKNTWPVLLLDDLFDKLDASRVNALAALLRTFEGAQVLITDTSRERLQGILKAHHFSEIRYYSVHQGEVEVYEEEA